MPWYILPRTGGQRMWLDHERPDLKPADPPDEAAAKDPKPAKPIKADVKKHEAPAE